MDWNRMKLKFFLGVLAPATLWACANPAPQIDMTFGEAVNAAKAKQTLNPQASANTDPVSGLDGAPAAESVRRYHQTFRAPPPTFVIINAAPAGGQ
jgi:hypothetical protein